jgi:hypothetical protein
MVSNIAMVVCAFFLGYGVHLLRMRAFEPRPVSTVTDASSETRVAHAQPTAATVPAVAHMALDMQMTLSMLREFEPGAFAMHSVQECVSEALARYPFETGERRLVMVNFGADADFKFFGSGALLVFMLLELIRHALQKTRAEGKGVVEIYSLKGETGNTLYVTDTALNGAGTASPQDAGHDKSPAMPLPLCAQVMQSFGGGVKHAFERGEYNSLLLTFPHHLRAV